MNRSRMIRRMAALALVAAAPSLAGAQDPIPAFGNRSGTLVAATPSFRFHSDFWMNLHQFLYGLTGGGPESGSGYSSERPECIATLDASRRAEWLTAVSYYRSTFARLPHRGGLMRDMRYQLNTLGRFAATDSSVRIAVSMLHAAAPAYRACFWDEHDAGNRARISVWLAALVRHEQPLRDALSAAFQAAWPRSVDVDVTPYVSFAGADTETGPGIEDHIMIATRFDDPTGFDGTEALLHESSHIVSGPRHGAVSEALREAAASLRVEVPRGLWHALAFYISGELVRRAAVGIGEHHTPYWIEHGLFPAYRSAIERTWRPYLNGDVDLATAARNLMAALSGA